MIKDLDLIRQEIDYGIWASYLDLCEENSRFSGLTTIHRINSNIIDILILDDRSFSNAISLIRVVAKSDGEYKILNFIILSLKPHKTETIDFIKPEQLKGIILDTFKTYYD